MDIIVNLAEGFMGLFDAGAETFVGWVTSIVPRVLLLLIFMNALIALIGQERINKFAKVCSGNVILAYGILPFLSAFMLGNPMALSMGKFLPERMKPSYYASASYHCHTNSGLFPHINVGEIFIYPGNCGRNQYPGVIHNTAGCSLSSGRSCHELYCGLGH